MTLSNLIISRIDTAIQNTLTTPLNEVRVEEHDNPHKEELISSSPKEVESTLTAEGIQELYKVLSTNSYLTSPSSQEYLFLKPFTFQIQEGKLIIAEQVETETLEHKLDPYVNSLYEYAESQGYAISPRPTIQYDHSIQELNRVFSKTGFYDPENFIITIFTEGRHPKDILKTFTHELIHHVQNVENRIPPTTTTNINEDPYLEELEQEAYLKGSILFRGWEDLLKNLQESENPCWSGYQMIGTKEVDGNQVPNCVPVV